MREGHDLLDSLPVNTEKFFSFLTEDAADDLDNAFVTVI
jgi:hypothetical protein